MTLDPADALKEEFIKNYAQSHLDFLKPYCYSLDCGSCLVLDLDTMVIKAREVLTGASKISKACWSWGWFEKPIYMPDPEGKTTLPSGEKVTAMDYRRYLWISFDSADDAMLSRITLLDLKKVTDADSRESSPGS